MEAAGGKGKIHATVFNVDLNKQFVPFWNGLIHLIGVIHNDVITMRYDWYDIIHECENFEKNYLNTSGFCESCVFYEMPSYLKEVMNQAKATGLSDCKEIAKDNDIIYTYCRQRQRESRFLWTIVFLVVIFFILVFSWKYIKLGTQMVSTKIITFYNQKIRKKNDASLSKLKPTTLSSV